MMYRTILTNHELEASVVNVLNEFRSTRRVDPRHFLPVLNGYENRYNLLHSTIEQLINNPKSKYHLLYSLSGALRFEHQLTQTKILSL